MTAQLILKVMGIQCREKGRHGRIMSGVQLHLDSVFATAIDASMHPLYDLSYQRACKHVHADENSKRIKLLYW